MYLIIIWTYLDLMEFHRLQLNYRGHWYLAAKSHLDGTRLYAIAVFLQSLLNCLHDIRLLPIGSCLNRNGCNH